MEALGEVLVLGGVADEARAVGYCVADDQVVHAVEDVADLVGAERRVLEAVGFDVQIGEAAAPEKGQREIYILSQGAMIKGRGAFMDACVEADGVFQIGVGEGGRITEDPSKFIIGTLRKYGRGVTANMGLGKGGSREVCS